MRRLLLVVAFLFVSAMACHADADDGQHQRRHDDDRVLKVFDSQGKLIGPLASYGRDDGVFLTIDGALVFVPIEPLNVFLPQSESAKYQWKVENGILPGCNGLPSISFNSGPRPSATAFTGTDVTVYIAGDTNSTLGCSPPPQPPQPNPIFNAESSYPLTAHYPPPLTLGY